jgi:hypothetical protein
MEEMLINVATTGFHHGRGEGSNRVEDASQIRVDDSFPVFCSAIQQCSALESDSGTINKDLRRASLALDFACHLLYRGFVFEVADLGEAATLICLNLFSDPVQGVTVAAEDHRFRPHPGKLGGDARADTTAPSGDDRGLPRN